jgi:NTP pyrophosphatase (non-canonical NTP hydrolase)
MAINELRDKAYGMAKSKGFHDTERNFGEMVALIHAELSEMLEAHREDRHCEKDAIDIFCSVINDPSSYLELAKGTVEEELADVIIRCLDLAGAMNIDIEHHIKAKMKYNSVRPHKHGKKY